LRRARFSDHDVGESRAWMFSLKAVWPSSLREVVTMSGLLRIIATIGAVVAALSNVASSASPQSVEPSPVRLEAKIPLGDVRDRIDHMAVDLDRQRLFVAELGNDSVGLRLGKSSAWSASPDDPHFYTEYCSRPLQFLSTAGSSAR
jgi:hypothetical protein